MDAPRPRRDAGYVALGDSYAAGVGADPSTWDAASGECRRSREAWPALLRTELATRTDASVAASAGDGAFTFAACTGAVASLANRKQCRTTTQGILRRKTVTECFPEPPSLRVQLAQASSELATAALVTVSVGGNDLHFADIITACVRGLRSCKGDIDHARGKIGALEATLAELFTEVRAAAPQARIVVTGYPELVRAPYLGGLPGLGQRYAIDASEVHALRVGVAELGATIKRACGTVGFTFVDMQPAFVGKACAGELELINCAVDLTGPGRPRSFHPDAGGNAAYAAVVLAAVTAL